MFCQSLALYNRCFFVLFYFCTDCFKRLLSGEGVFLVFHLPKIVHVFACKRGQRIQRAWSVTKIVPLLLPWPWLCCCDLLLVALPFHPTGEHILHPLETPQCFCLLFLFLFICTLAQLYNRSRPTGLHVWGGGRTKKRLDRPDKADVWFLWWISPPWRLTNL